MIVFFQKKTIIISSAPSICFGRIRILALPSCSCQCEKERQGNLNRYVHVFVCLCLCCCCNCCCCCCYCCCCCICRCLQICIFNSLPYRTKAVIATNTFLHRYKSLTKKKKMATSPTLKILMQKRSQQNKSLEPATLTKCGCQNVRESPFQEEIVKQEF